jgi:hypothetical protein
MTEFEQSEIIASVTQCINVAGLEPTQARMRH